MSRRAASADRRLQILRVALSCFARYGFDGTTTRMIQQAAGVSAGSFYHHFGSKAGVAAELFLEGLRDKNRAVETMLTPARTAEKAVKAVVCGHVRWIARHPDWAGFLYQHRDTVRAAAAETRLQEINRAFSRLLMDHFRAFLDDGSVRRLPSECYSVIILGPVQEYARRWLKGRAEQDLVELEGVFADAAWNAIRRP